MEREHNQSKYFILIASSSFILVLIFSYYNFFIKNDYGVSKQVVCYPEIEPCFVSDCETNDPACDQETTYKKITAPSKYAGSDYDAFTCDSRDRNCTAITCNSDTIEPGEKCFE